MITPFILFLLVVLGFFVFDPYKILYNYDNYNHSLTDRDYYGIEMLKKNYHKYNYDSFLFGSSRTLAFQPNKWAEHLPENSAPFALDGFAENLYGIYHKVKYLDSLDINIKNAIILIDVYGTFVKEGPNREMVQYYKHPDIDNSSWFEFYKDHLKAYLVPNRISAYYLNKFFGLKNDYVNFYIGDVNSSVDSITNGLRRDDLEERIKKEKTYYDNAVFYQRQNIVEKMPTQITEKHLQRLYFIRDVFEKDKTDYKIIIGPMYIQKILSDQDLDCLRQIFGSSNVYDFSGVNDFTINIKNYYESSHYRPLVGDSIMNYIYRESK